MPEGTSVHRVYQSLLRQGKDKGTAARIAQAQTGLSLHTGKPSMNKALFVTSEIRFSKQLRKAGNFEESKHPRDEDGKFTSGGGGGGASGSGKKPKREKKPKKPKQRREPSYADIAMMGLVPLSLAATYYGPPTIARGLHSLKRKILETYNRMKVRQFHAANAAYAAEREAARNAPRQFRSEQIIPPTRMYGPPKPPPLRSANVEDLFRVARGTWRRA